MVTFVAAAKRVQLNWFDARRKLVSEPRRRSPQRANTEFTAGFIDECDEFNERKKKTFRRGWREILRWIQECCEEDPIF